MIQGLIAMPIKQSNSVSLATRQNVCKRLHFLLLNRRLNGVGGFRWRARGKWRGKVFCEVFKNIDQWEGFTFLTHASHWSILIEKFLKIETLHLPLYLKTRTQDGGDDQRYPFLPPLFCILPGPFLTFSFWNLIVSFQ